MIHKHLSKFGNPRIASSDLAVIPHYPHLPDFAETREFRPSALALMSEPPDHLTTRQVNKQVKSCERPYYWDVQAVTDQTVLRQRDLTCLLPTVLTTVCPTECSIQPDGSTH
ncbi:hypothetical protein BU23DRAFT_338 [Bimuria novae-zelandiae CBS 107.79]|uniref:Uncharacterized protein n=1 Tax=Bimuria novae-zelandiae CBS 107.79 TaxID=1447943 RepID=A0A6A5VSX9_9PLEO|nr:hypothetical protein BU23DRAFT_338 [Bimuria novae-zelandiae CBS 107.79]